MAYVAVTGGQEAIKEAQGLTTYYRLKNAEEKLDIASIQSQMRHLIDKIMGEGGLYAPSLAALALKQSEGDPLEAAFLIRAYRSTLPRNHYSHILDTADMRVIRRISSAFKDIPGGQILGPTNDYTHRLLNFSLLEEDDQVVREFLQEYHIVSQEVQEEIASYKKVSDLLRAEGLMGACNFVPEHQPFDITRERLSFPAPRSAKLQTLARAETGAMMALAYSSMRGYGAVHPTIGELRVGYLPVYVPHPFSKDPEDAPYIGEILMTEGETINSFTLDKDSGNIQFLLGQGLCFGQNEVKAISMAILERSLETKGSAPAQDDEFVLSHIDCVEAYGFVSHLKLPHYVTFQSYLDRIRQTREKEGKNNDL